MKRGSILSVSAIPALALALCGITAANTAGAAEIDVLCAVALHPAMDELIPGFERSTGHKVTTAYGTAGDVVERVEKGQAADLVISAAPLMDKLQGRREARHQLARRLQALDVGREIDCLS
jgi:molybdate transport system substrate-binding protein